MKGENSRSELKFIHSYLSVFWQALHLYCKWICKKCKIEFQKLKGKVVMACSSAAGWQNGKFSCCIWLSYAKLSLHHASCIIMILYVLCIASLFGSQHTRILRDIKQNRFLSSLVISLHISNNLHSCVGCHTIKLRKWQWHTLSLCTPTMSPTFVCSSFGDSWKQRLRQIHSPQDKNSWQESSSPQPWRLMWYTTSVYRLKFITI